MSTAVIVFLNVFFIAFVLIAIVGLCALPIVSDKSFTASFAGRRARLRAAILGRSQTPTPTRRRAGGALGA